MFIGFFSDIEYHKIRWCDVFYLENTIQSLVREFWFEMIELPDSELLQYLKELLLEFNSQNNLCTSYDERFVDTFLNNEISSIRTILKKIKTNGIENVVSDQSSFVLRHSYFMQCIKVSKSLKNYLCPEESSSNSEPETDIDN